MCLLRSSIYPRLIMALGISLEKTNDFTCLVRALPDVSFKVVIAHLFCYTNHYLRVPLYKGKEQMNGD